MIEAGTYTAVAVDAEFGESAKAKTPQIFIGFRITGPEGSTAVGQEVSYYGYFTDGSNKYTIDAMRNAGWTGDFTDISSLKDSTHECQLVIEHEDYDGKTQVKVAWVNVAGRAKTSAKPMGDKDKKKFAAKMNNVLKQLEGKQKDPRDMTDDVPFDM
jgi:hypothetical protein